MLSSARRLLVPDTMMKSPARLKCGYLPRGAALPGMTADWLDIVMLPSSGVRPYHLRQGLLTGTGFLLRSTPTVDSAIIPQRTCQRFAGSHPPHPARV